MQLIKEDYLKLLDDKDIVEVAGHMYLYKLDKSKIITQDSFSHPILYRMFLACAAQYETKSNAGKISRAKSVNNKNNKNNNLLPVNNDIIDKATNKSVSNRNNENTILLPTEINNSNSADNKTAFIDNKYEDDKPINNIVHTDEIISVTPMKSLSSELKKLPFNVPENNTNEFKVNHEKIKQLIDSVENKEDTKNNITEADKQLIIEKGFKLPKNKNLQNIILNSIKQNIILNSIKSANTFNSVGNRNDENTILMQTEKTQLTVSAQKDPAEQQDITNDYINDNNVSNNIGIESDTITNQCIKENINNLNSVDNKTDKNTILLATEINNSNSVTNTITENSNSVTNRSIESDIYVENEVLNDNNMQKIKEKEKRSKKEKENFNNNIYNNIYNNNLNYIQEKEKENNIKEKEKEVKTEVKTVTQNEVNTDWLFPETTSTNESPEKVKRFVKPTLQQMKDYISENNMQVNAEDLFNYYESVGWTVGKNKKMKDWKAAVRYCERNNKNKKSSSNNYSSNRVIPKGWTSPHEKITEEDIKRWEAAAGISFS